MCDLKPIQDRTVAAPQAKRLIRELLEKSGPLDQLEISERLRIQLSIVFELLDELVAAGKIAREPYDA